MSNYIVTDPNAIFNAALAVRDMGSSSSISALLLDGPPGTGKTSLAKTIACFLDAEFLQFQFYPGCGAEALLFDTAFATPNNPRGDGIIPRAISMSIKGTTVLLLDEVDKGDVSSDSFLLNFLSEGILMHPQVGTLKANSSSLLVVITKNDQRQCQNALLRRCRVVYFAWPTIASETTVLLSYHPWLTVQTCDVLLEWPSKLRNNPGVIKPPSTPEIIRLIDDLALLIISDRKPVTIGEFFINSICPILSDRSFVERSPLYLGTHLIESFSRLNIPLPTSIHSNAVTKLLSLI